MLDNVLQATEAFTGFVIVLLVLCLLWGLTALIGRICQAAEMKREAVAPASPVTAPPPAIAREDDVSGEEIAVIAAAVTALLNQRHQIVSIRPTASRWGAQGRSDLHASHRLRP